MKQAEKQAQALDTLKSAGGGLLKLAANPYIGLTAAFVATNLLQHIQVGNYTYEVPETDTTYLAPPTIVKIFPFLGVFFPPEGAPTGNTSGTQPLTYLTADQANVARGALVALAASGALKDVTGFFKAIA